MDGAPAALVRVINTDDHTIPADLASYFDTEYPEVFRYGVLARKAVTQKAWWEKHFRKSQLGRLSGAYEDGQAGFYLFVGGKPEAYTRGPIERGSEFDLALVIIAVAADKGDRLLEIKRESREKKETAEVSDTFQKHINRNPDIERVLSKAAEAGRAKATRRAAEAKQRMEDMFKQWKSPPPPPPPPTARVPTLDEDYATLGAAATSTIAELTALYRDKAQRNHPDKVAHMDPEFRALAEERFKALQAAWERIKKARSIG